MTYHYIWKINLKDSVSEEDFKKHRHDGSMILQEYPGAIGTHIHATRDETRCFFLVAERESITARNAMSQDAELGQADRANQWKVFPPNDSFGGIISFAGEEIGVVSPEKQ